MNVSNSVFCRNLCALSAVQMEASQLVVPVSMLLTGDSGACWQVSSK